MGRRGLERALDEVERRLAREGGAADLLAERGLLLATLGRIEAARAAYLEALRLVPDHFATLMNFGALLYATDFRNAAQTVFARAATIHPHQPLAHLNLANALMYEGEPEAARAHLETALRLDPNNAGAHQRLSELLREAGEVEAARLHRALGFGASPVEFMPWLGEGEPARLLVLTSTPAGDVRWRQLVDESAFAVTTLVAEFWDPQAPLPPHDLIFNAIGDADLCRDDLIAADALIAGVGAPVINPPVRVIPTGRAQNAARLGALPGVRAPSVRVLDRQALSAEALAALGFEYPLLLRSPGFHTGLNFARVEASEDLPAAVAGLPGPELMAIEYLDARGADGLARKYRVMMIGGALYPLHLAVSAQWKVHYFTSAMAGRADLQAEEKRFLSDMPGTLGPKAMEALRAIQSALGLDYAGVDFGLDADGNLLLFEANAVMNLAAPDASAEWDYRRPAISRAVDAARAVVTGAAPIRP